MTGTGVYHGHEHYRHFDCKLLLFTFVPRCGGLFFVLRVVHSRARWRGNSIGTVSLPRTCSSVI